MSQYGKGTGRPRVEAVGDGRVKEAPKELSDVNSIVARYRRNGSFDHVSKAAPIFADVSQIGDFRGCVARVRAAEEAFDSLPAVIRSRFSNDPAKLVDFIQDPANLDEGVKLGLMKVVPKEAPKEPAAEPEGEPAVKPKVVVKKKSMKDSDCD